MCSSGAALPVREQSGEKQMGGCRTRTVDADWPKGYAVPCGVMLNNKMEKSWLGGQLLLREWVAHQSVGGENCTVHHLFCIFFYLYHYHYYYFPFLFYPINLSLSQPICFTFYFLDSLSHSTMGSNE